MRRAVRFCVLCLAAFPLSRCAAAELMFQGLVDFSEESPALLARLRAESCKLTVDRSFLYAWKDAPKIPEFEIPWETARQRLHAYQSWGSVYASPDSATIRVVLHQRDWSSLSPQARTRIATAAFEHREGPVRLVRYDPQQENEAPAYNELPELVRDWTTLNQKFTGRVVAFDGFLGVSVAPDDADKERAALLERFTDTMGDHADAAAQRPAAEPAAALAKTMQESASSLFATLDRRALMNDRLQIYKIYWYSQVSRPLMSPTVEFNKQDVEMVAAFNHNLTQANAGNTCTLYISSSRGRGAEVEYALPADADAGKWLSAPTSTMVTFDVPRGKYRFRALRYGKQTSQKNLVDCNRAHYGFEFSEN